MWENCWSSARFHLKLSDRQFGELTPRQFYLLLDRHTEEVEHGKMLAGIVAATVANFGYRRPKKALRPMDFFAGAPKERVNRKQQMADTRAALMSMVTKTVKRQEKESN